MGYYTRYSLKYTVPSTFSKSEIKFLEDYLDSEEASEYGSIFEISNYDIKWYDHEDDMRNLSLKFPSVLFVLDGEGEESGDIWKKYFKNGKMQCSNAIISFEPFDEDLLQ